MRKRTLENIYDKKRKIEKQTYSVRGMFKRRLEGGKKLYFVKKLSGIGKEINI